MKSHRFKPVSPQIDFPALEKEILENWYKSGLVDKYLHKNDKSKTHFSFLDGPITANNPMGVHHAWGRTYKDLWQRFHTMLGDRQRYQNGFDCQGLWVEVEVEKDLGFKSKKDIEIYGVANFVEKCKERVLKYSGIQTEQSKRLGYFADWDHSYYTMSDENNYMIWHMLKVCYKNGWIYKGHESIPWCPRCETAISQHEMLTEDYKEVTHKSIYFSLPLVDRPNEKLLVWTTTPWTLPANVAVAVDKELDYVLVKGYWVVKGKEDLIGGEIEKTLKGGELAGLKYRAPFDALSKVKKVAGENPETFHRVIITDPKIMPISGTEGTGLVHTAVSAGTEDFQMGKKLGLPMIPVIKDNADYMDDMDFLSGQNAKKHPEIVFDAMSDFVFKIENYTHRYPACWRCKTELVWKVADEWYIGMDIPDPKDPKRQTLRDQLKEVTKKITWMPGFGLDRELDWLSNMHDWLISKKNRYWGLALPIYECIKCGNFEVIGGKEELMERAIDGWKEFDGHTPHKPWVDEVKIKCSKCGEVVPRIPDVGNPWLDAGIVPFSTIAEPNGTEPLYLKNKKEWQKWFPADFITESFPGQFKNWFYSLLVMGTVLENEYAFKNVLGFGSLLAEDGRPMHKSWGNAIEFNEGADKIGADVMRWLYTRSNPSDNLLFGYTKADDVRRQFFLILWNSYNFFVSYALFKNWTPKKTNANQSVLDKWILSRLNETTKIVTESLLKYDSQSGALALESFVSDFSTWYIRRSRDRVGEEFFQTTFEILTVVSRLLAPFMPFVSEEIYKNLTGEESVHLTKWPNAGDIDQNLIENMSKVRKIVELGHAKRKENNLKVRQPLAKIVVSGFSVPENLTYLIKDELNVKSVEMKSGNQSVDLDTKLTPDLIAEGNAREIVRQIQDARKEAKTALDEKIVVTIPSWPEKYEEFIKKNTLTEKLQKGDTFSIERVK